jgi:DNA-binding NarL/FixJ family response regulator
MESNRRPAERSPGESAMTESSIRFQYTVLAVGAFALLTGVEVLSEGAELDMVDLLADSLQTALVVATAVGVALLAGRFESERDEKRALTRDLEVARAEGRAWRERAQGYLAGLSEEIEKQFEAWKLTSAEREVSLLMLKGFTHGEIAGLRGTTEATVRHQARAVYQKSGMAGRSSFCAYFLEDLLPEREA